MTYRIAPFSVTFSDLGDHLPIASLLKCDFQYSCAALDHIMTASLTVVMDGHL